MIIGAFPTAGGIQVNRQVAPDTLSCALVFEGDPDWMEAVAAAAQFGHEVTAPEPPAPTLAAAQAAARRSVNAVRGEVRSRFITGLPGQDMVYLEKEREARDWVAARASGGNAPDPGDYPHILGECGITAPDMDQVAQVYLNMAAMFRRVSAVIEAHALAAIATVDQAPTPEDALAAAQAFPPALAAALFNVGIPI